MTDRALSRLPNEGEAAYFVHLHLTTLEQCKADKPNHKGEWVYKVKGKPRPMLVIRADPKRDRGSRWYLTLPITSKNRDERGKMLEPIGNCLDESIQDFVEMQIYKVPANMLHRENGKSPIIKPCDRLSFSNAVRVVTHKALGAQSQIRTIVGYSGSESE